MTRALLRALLRLAPADFRRRYGGELLRVHEERAEAPRGWPGRAAFGVREVTGMLTLVTRLRFGGAGGDGTTTRGEGMFERLRQDLRFAIRTLRRNPGYAATAVTVLALGIGANAAIFSAANAFFFRPLPFRDADRLVMLYETNPEFGWEYQTAAPANVLDWRDRVDAFEDVATYTETVGRAPYMVEGEPVLVGVGTVSGNFFDVLGAPPALGRTFRWDETWSSETAPVVLSHAFWASRLGEDPDVVGKTIEVGSSTAEVVGVMPEGFAFPDDEVEMWRPWGWDREYRSAVWFRRAHWVRPVARLAPGVTPARAHSELQAVVASLQEEYPETNSVMGAGLMPLRQFMIRDVRRPLLALFGAVGLLLLLACVNVASLALVRAGERSREVALRYALGAGRGRVGSLLVTESLVLAGLGGLVGLGLGWVGVRSMEGLASLGIEGATGVVLDHRVVLFTVALSGLAGIVFGLAPLLQATLGQVAETLREGGRGDAGGRRRLRASGLLVAVEVALALLIVVGAGLMLRTAWLLRSEDPGFRPEGVLAVQFALPSARYEGAEEVRAFFAGFLETLEGRPGVERAGLVEQLPLAGTSWSSQFQAAGWPPDRVGFEILHRSADPGYFEALGIPVVRGRLFEPGDGPDVPPVVVINEAFAREHFPGEDPLGQRIAYDRQAGPESNWRTIVGIVGDQNQVSPGQPPRPEVFESMRQEPNRSPWIVLRTVDDPLSVAPVVREALREADPLIPIAQVRPLREVWRSSMAREELILALLVIFGVLAMVLAAVGIYGVTAQAARSRTREIGIRMALGAGRSDVVGLMLRQGAAAVAIGLAVGLMGALAGARVLESLLYRVEPTDPGTFAAVTLVLGSVAMAASWVPARRATRVDPVESLRVE